MDLFTDIGPVEAARRVREQIGDVATIVSVDMDVLEPGECPGVGFLETGEDKEQLKATFWLLYKHDSSGGMTSRELFRFLRALRGLNVIGGEVSSKY